VVGQLRYLEFLDRLHVALRPATYLEIGVGGGHSLALARARSIGIDPEFSITAPIAGNVALFRTTSDEYFARPEPLAPFSGAPVDLAFLDGPPRFESTLRDLIHVERASRPSSVIVVRGIFPRAPDDVARQDSGPGSTGDIYSVVEVLRQYRPDLTLTLVDTLPTGLLLVSGLDPRSPVLTDRYDEIVEKYAGGDPRDVPPAILNREGALAPESVLASPVWGALRRGRRPWVTPGRVRSEMTEALERPDTYRLRRRDLRRAASRTLTDATRRVRSLRAR
jgi:hypothetical protein